MNTFDKFWSAWGWVFWVIIDTIGATVTVTYYIKGLPWVMMLGLTAFWCFCTICWFFCWPKKTKLNEMEKKGELQ